MDLLKNPNYVEAGFFLGHQLEWGKGETKIYMIERETSSQFEMK